MTHAALALPTPALLRDGGSIVIRPVEAADRPQLLSLFGRMGPLSIRHRYFEARTTLTDAELSIVTSIGPDRIALAATAIRGGDEVFLGVGHYIRLAPGGESAEVAFEVADADQERGIGTLLLEHLAAHARGNGITTFHASVEADNAQMLELFGRSGFTLREWIDDGIVELDLAIAATPHYLEAAGSRERIADARSIRPLFAPRTVAVIGVSRTPGTIGRTIVDNLVNNRFTGTVYPVNPHTSEIAAMRCYPSVHSIGKPIDLAVIATPAAAVLAAVRDCAAAGVRAVVVISAGFAEASGAAGAEAERALRAEVRAAGMRLVGPNCMGVLSTDPSIRLDATFALVSPPTGGVSLATQSGALGIAMIDRARAAGLGIADFASIGNSADVSVNDLLAYWYDEARTRVIALYLESFGDPRAFARLAPLVARRKPIVAVKSGRSAAGTRAAHSHSAALASLDVGIDALFAQAGVIRTDTFEQMFDVTALLANQPVPRGARVAIVTNAGGPGILLADACEARGLELPLLGEATLARLRELLPAHAGYGNPIDMIATATPGQYEKTIELVGRDEGVDSVIAIYVPVAAAPADDYAAAIARGAGRLPAGKPIATVFMAPGGAPPRLAFGARGIIPAYAFPENAAIALAAAVRYGKWRARPLGDHLALGADTAGKIRALVDRCMAARPTGGWLAADDVAALLALAGVPATPQRRCAPTAQAALAAARELGYPVVLKADAPDVVHKSEAGGVALGLVDDDAVIAVTERMRGRIAGLAGFVVQRQTEPGLEMLVGVTTDPALGPLLVAGFGGTAVEIDKDVAFRLTPLTNLDAEEMLQALRGRARLDGFRGAPPGDRRAFIDLVRRVAALVEIAPEIADLDLNPVILHPQGAVVVDARILVAPRAPRARIGEG